MANLKALRPHLSADGVYRAVGDTYEDENVEHVKQRVHYGIVETVEAEAKSKPKSKTKDEGKANVTDEQTTGDTAGLIED